jgi:hypothetical protein
MYVKSNATAGAGATQVVPTTTINSNDLILGYTLINGAAGVSAGVGLYDTTAIGTATGTTLFAEAETVANGDSMTVWFPYAKQLSGDGQLTILLGDTVCTVIVYYEDR